MRNYRPVQERDVILAYLPGNSQAFLKRIQVYLEAKEKLVDLPFADLKQRQILVENALEKNQDNVEKLHELAILYELQNKLPKATDVLEDALQELNNEDCPDIYMQLGTLYEYQGKNQEALDAYREACERWKEGGLKLRPAICLRKLPPNYRDFLVCGISSQTERCQLNFDEVVGPEFDKVKLLKRSVIRLGFLGRVGTQEIEGHIGSISPARHRRLLRKLGTYLVK